LPLVEEDWPHVELHPPPPADSDVVTVTGVVTGGVVPVTVSTSDPQVLVEAALVESPE
jgi:prolyl-tRNA editing enzyme YbaK/EbsC (Cys-tRNA(Pro) deacylase)